MLTTRRRRHRTLHSASIPPILSYKQITFCSHDVASIHPHNCTVLHLLPHHQLLHCLYVLPPKISETSIFFKKKTSMKELPLGDPGLPVARATTNLKLKPRHQHQLYCASSAATPAAAGHLLYGLNVIRDASSSPLFPLTQIWLYGGTLTSAAAVSVDSGWMLRSLIYL